MVLKEASQQRVPSSGGPGGGPLCLFPVLQPQLSQGTPGHSPRKPQLLQVQNSAFSGEDWKEPSLGPFPSLLRDPQGPASWSRDELFPPVGVPNTGALRKQIPSLQLGRPPPVPPPGWPAALKGKVTVGEQRAGGLGAPALCSDIHSSPPGTLAPRRAVGHKLCVRGGSQSHRRGRGSLPALWRGDLVGRTFLGLRGHQARGVRPSVGFLRPQPPFPLRQEPPWFPRSRVPSLAWPAAVSHSAEGGWGFPFLGGRASAGTLPQGQSGPGPPRHPRVGQTPGPAWHPPGVLHTPLPSPCPAVGTGQGRSQLCQGPRSRPLALL